MQRTLITFLSVVLLSSCASTNNTNNINSRIEALLAQEHSPIVFEKEPTPILVSVKTPRDILLDKQINISIKEPVNVIVAIDFADSSLSISPDAGVDLHKKFRVKFNNQTLDKYFIFLENITGYDIELVDNVVYVRSVEEKTWNLQTLSMFEETISSARAEVGSSGATPQVAQKDNSDWLEIVANVRNIMNSEIAQNPTLSNNPNPLQNSSPKAPIVVITDNQRLGTIHAIGLPSKIRQVDSWLGELIGTSNRQVHLQVQVLDVTVDESVGQGINWNLISNQKSPFQIGVNTQQPSIENAGIFSIGNPAGTVIDLGKKFTLDVMLNYLRRQGKVKINNQPNITTTNGREAYISTGDEFSFVASIDAVPDDNGNVITTSEIERISVGVDMRVTPKIIGDGRIVISVVPVISSLQSFSTLSSGNNQTFQTPNIALQQLATQAIVESGKTFHLGGLISSRVADATRNLPSGGLFDFLFKGVQKSLERREVVILITPTIVK